MKSRILEFRPAEEQANLVINPVNNFIMAFTGFIDSLVDQRVREELDKRLGEFSVQPPAEAPAGKQMLKAKEIGKIFGFAETTIIDMAESGKIPMAVRHKKGKKVFRRFYLEEVKAALSRKNGEEE